MCSSAIPSFALVRILEGKPKLASVRLAPSLRHRPLCGGSRLAHHDHEDVVFDEVSPG